MSVPSALELSKLSEAWYDALEACEDNLWDEDLAGLQAIEDAAYNAWAEAYDAVRRANTRPYLPQPWPTVLPGKPA
jgi:hypothetical protein